MSPVSNIPVRLRALALGLAWAAGSGLRGAPVELFLHGWVQGNLGTGTGGVAARTATRLAELRRAEPGLVVLASGNMLGPSATSEVDGGATAAQVMAELGHDASAVGPHDLFAGPANLLTRVAASPFPWVWSNFEARGEALARAGDWGRIRPYVRIVRDGRTVLVFGVIAPALVADWPGWEPGLVATDPVARLAALRAEAGPADLVVVAGSLGLKDASALLSALPWVDLVVTQQVGTDESWDYATWQLERTDGRRILWTSCYGQQAATASLARVDGRLVGAARLHPLAPELAPGLPPIPEDPGVAALVARVEAAAAEVAGTPLATLAEAERADFPGTLLEALRAELRAEVAFIHRGAIKPVPPDNPITRTTLRRAFAFPDKAALLQVPGATLRALWARRDEPLINGKGLVFAGLAERQGKLAVNGRALRDADKYRVATVEFLALGGLDLLPRAPAGLRDEGFVDLLARHFEGRGPARAGLYRAARARPVHRISTKLDASLNRLDFSGAADRYQFRDPNALFNASDIPGMVGLQNKQSSFSLDHEHVIDREASDLTLRLRANFLKLNQFKLLDRTSFLVRHEEKSLSRRPKTFAELAFTGTWLDPDVPGIEHPLFGKAVVGKALKAGRDLKLFLGAGHVERFSTPGSPSDTGLNLGAEHVWKISDKAALETTLDSFAGLGDQQLRIFDLSAALRVEIVPGISTVIKSTTYLFKDSVVDRTGVRDELFVGLSFGRGARRY